MRTVTSESEENLPFDPSLQQAHFFSAVCPHFLHVVYAYAYHSVQASCCRYIVT